MKNTFPTVVNGCQRKITIFKADWVQEVACSLISKFALLPCLLDSISSFLDFVIDLPWQNITCQNVSKLSFIPFSKRGMHSLIEGMWIDNNSGIPLGQFMEASGSLVLRQSTGRLAESSSPERPLTRSSLQRWQRSTTSYHEKYPNHYSLVWFIIYLWESGGLIYLTTHVS